MSIVFAPVSTVIVIVDYVCSNINKIIICIKKNSILLTEVKEITFLL